MNNKEHSGFFKHGFMMIICCLLPIIIVSAVTFLGIKGRGISILASLICPIGMGIMMFSMMGKDKGGTSCHDGNRNNTSVESENKE